MIDTGKDSVGQIALDLVVNKNDFEKQMTGIRGLAKKAGAALAGAFAIKKLVDFSKSCIELGSDLAEVQNVVDVTFPHMNQQINQFAQNAAKQFGLSETMAKRFTGTFGAMAKAFGFGEKAAYDMSTTLTGLAGDVASFYNIGQDEAYTKLKSVFTGETESLKDLGIVMTQTALDAYALQNGFGKTTAKMSEMEKVALRYKFVQDQLTTAAGDFSRTSDGWANQVRILQLQFDSLKATIGQGLINVLSPVIHMINALIGKLMSLANAFRAFTELVMGKRSGDGASAAAAGMEAVAKAADKAGTAAGGAGSAAKKAAKDMKGVSTGIDELNIINPSDSAGNSGLDSAGGGGYDVDDFDIGSLSQGEDVASEKLKGILDLMNQLKSSFVAGFWDAFGDTTVFDSIQNSIRSIKDRIKEITTDPEVQNAALKFADRVMYALGQISGSVASVGATIADNLLGGIDLYLQQNVGRIKEYIISMFDIGSGLWQITGDFSSAIADIFSVFRSDSAKQITADIIQIFSDGFMGATELAGLYSTDILDLLVTPIVKNSEKIKEAWNGTLEALQIVTSSLASTFRSFVDGLLQLYDGHIRPLIQSFRDGFSEIYGSVLDAFHTYILPVLQDAADQFESFSLEYLQPLIDKFLEFAGKVSDAIRVVWEEILQPFIIWFCENIAPIIARDLQNAIDMFFIFFEAVADVISHVLDALGGLIDFVVGVFTGDWRRAWDGIKTYYAAVWEAMKTIVSTLFEAIRVMIANILSAISRNWNANWDSIKSFASAVWSGIKALAVTVFSAIRDKLSEIWDSVKRTIEDKWTAIKEWFVKIWQKIKDVFKLDEMLDIGKGIMNKLWDGLKSVWSDITGWLEGIVDVISNTFKKVTDGAKNLFKKAKKDAEDDGDSDEDDSGYVDSGPGAVKGHASGGFPKSGQMFVANEDGNPELVGSWGGRAAVANNQQITQGIAQAVQNGMRSCMAPIVSQMASIAQNAAPPLTTVGTGRSYSPDGQWLQSMAERAMSLDTASMSDQYLAMMVDLLKQIIDLIENLDLTVNIDIREIKKKLTDLEKRSGYTLRTT